MKRFSTMIQSFQQCFLSLEEKASIKYFKELVAVAILMVVAISSFFLYRIYAQNREEKAFVALSEVIDACGHALYQTRELDPAKDKDMIQSIWKDAIVLIDALYKEHINSNLAGYFLVFKVDAILQSENNIEEAITVLDEALKKISKKSVLYPVYYLKRLKLGLDSNNAQEQSLSLSSLIALSENFVSPVCQEALYTLSQYYFAYKNNDAAYKVLQSLIAQEDKNSIIKSPWISLAYKNLGYLDNETVA